MSTTGSPSEPTPPGLAPLEIEFFPTYVLGYPMHVAITVRADRPGATLKRLPRPSVDSLEDAIGVLAVDDRDTVVGRREPNPVVDPDLGVFGFTLRAGEARRFLVDLSDALPWESIGPGTFTLTVSYASEYAAAAAPLITISLRAPTAKERAVLDDLAPELAAAGSWGGWSRTPARDPGSLRGPFDPADPLRFLRVRRYLLQGDDHLASIDPSSLGVLDGPYEPEAIAIAAEIAWAQGARAGFTALSARLRQRAPGLAHRLDEIVAGQTDLVFAEQERNEREEERRASGAGP